MDWRGVIRWPQLCGEENDTRQGIFWDYDKLMSTSSPDFPPCFQITVLIWISCGFLWSVAPFYCVYLYTLRDNYQRTNKTRLNIIKIVLSVLLLGVSLADFIQTFSERTSIYNPPVALYLDAGVRTITYGLSAILIHLVFSVGIHSSGILFCFWTLQMLLNIVQFRSRLLHEEVAGNFRFITFYISYGLIIVNFILEFVPDVRPVEEEPNPDETETTPLLGNKKKYIPAKTSDLVPCPELKSTFPALMTHWWITQYLVRGFRKPLVYEDLPDILPRDDSTTIVDSFYDVWHKESRTKSKPSLLRALLGPCLGDIMIAAVCRMLDGFGSFANPLLLQAVIGWVNSDDPYTWKGYVLAVLLLVLNFVLAIIFHQFFKYSYISAYKMRTAIISAVYRKALRLSSATRRTMTTGEIVNLMSVDAQKIHDVAFEIHEMWAAPIVAVLAMVMLWNLVGASSLAGLAVLLLLAPLNGTVFARKYAQHQEEQMKHKDTRIKKTNELLNGIMVLKMYAWENPFSSSIKDVRRDELKCVRSQAIYSGIMFGIWLAAPFLVPLSIFVTYVLVNPEKGLDPQIAFVTINLSNILNWTLSFLPILMAQASQAYVSGKRIINMLQQDELDPSAVNNLSNSAHAVSIEEATFTWGNDEETPVLRDISLDISEGSLVAVVGQVGSGKSSLMSAMLGELRKLEGSVNVKGSVAYVSQQAWIQNATLRDNILFGQELRKNQYDDLIDACALREDLKVLPVADQTEIGEKGINLSGGQKQRVSLARAMYQNKDMYLLDDPLSAVDAHVGKHIFEKAIGPNGLLNTKTRILVTHGVTFLPQCDVIVLMRNGEVSEVGHYQELLERNGAFTEFLGEYLKEEQEDSDSENLVTPLQQQTSTVSEDSYVTSEGEQIAATTQEQRLRKRKSSSREGSTSQQLSRTVSKDAHPAGGGTLIEEEAAEIGSIKCSVLKNYAAAAGSAAVIAGLVFSIAYITSQVLTNVWLAAWTDDPVGNGTQPNTALRLGVYAGLGIIQAGFVFGCAVSVLFGGVVASRKLHDRLLERIIRAPMSFFDTTPSGRIINRFSTDMDKLDNSIPMYLRWMVFNVSTLISTTIMISYSTPLFLVVVIPLGILTYIIQRVYIGAVRQMKRIDSIRKSPIYVNFDETLHGVMTIRAFHKESDFIEKNDRLINENMRSWYPIVISQRWLGFFLGTLGAVVIFFATVFAVLARGSITAGLVGLSVNFAMQTTWGFNQVTRNMTELETDVVSAERIKEFSEVKQEKPWSIEDTKPRLSWPDKGVIRFTDYSTRYRPGLSLVLKNLKFYIKAGEKVGVVGRTGAGKSSVTLGLCRILEPATGNIVIDGVDITKIGLHDLRSRLTIIPQDPVLFAGSLRTNLDPLDDHNDEEIWKVLQLAHLKSFVTGLTAGLTYEVGEGGEALSVGQRQLVCLARALLRRSQILVLDEATAAVDLETDDLIQTTIRSAFRGCTVLTIAHRLNTIMDYDRVLVLDHGEILEFEKPSVLLDNKSSIFHSMATDAGLL